MNPFKLCNHGEKGEPLTEHWFLCPSCVDEVQMALVIARSHLNELANAQFNDSGDCTAPIAEPFIRGRSFQQIAKTALDQIT